MIAFYLVMSVLNLRKQSRVLTVANFEIEVDNILDNAVFKTTADRSLLFKFHNGGSKIYAGAKKYISVYSESHNHNLHSVEDDWQKIEADKTDMMLMQKIINDGVVLIDVKKMEPSKLKRAYDAGGIKSSILFKIWETPHCFYYLSFCSLSEFNQFVGTNNFSTLELTAEKLRNLFRATNRKGVLR